MRRRQFLTKGTAVAIGAISTTLPFFNNCSRMKLNNETSLDPLALDSNPAPETPLQPPYQMPTVPSGPIQEQDMPLWRRNQAINEWREIPNTKIGALAPTNEARCFTGLRNVLGPNGRLDAWCGLSIDTRYSQIWSVANGGHGDYFGNEVCQIDLMADAPKWIEWCQGSTGNVVDDTTPANDPSAAGAYFSRYSDGLPVATHSYYGQQFIEKQNRAIRMGGSISMRGSAYENVEGFDVSKGPRNLGAWDRAGTFGLCLGGVNGGWTPSIGWSACKDPVSENVYTISTPFIHKFVPFSNQPGGTWSKLGTIPNQLNSGVQGATAIDTRRNRLIWLKGYGSVDLAVCDLETGIWTLPPLTGGLEKSDLVSLTSSLGLVYVPAIDKFMARGGASGSKIFIIDPETFAVSYLPTTGVGTTQNIGQTVILGREEGVFNRFLLVPLLRGILYFPRADSNGWFIRLY